jgi:hypothetical protein
MLIHIGYHKTGTTWLQDHVFNNPSKGFVSRWTVGTGEAIEYFVLKNEFQFDPEEVRDAFKKSHSGAKNLIPVISHEDLSGYPIFGRYYGPQVARRLQATFPHARVLIVVREQKSMLMSLYRQYIRQDGEWPLAAFIGDGTERPGFVPICRLDHLEYHSLVNLYFSLFGRSNVLVLPYELLPRDGRMFEQRIYAFTGSGGTADGVPPPANVGWLGATLALRRQINKFIRKSPHWQGQWNALPLSYRAAYRLCNIVDRIAPKSWHRAVDKKLKGQIEERVAGHYRQSNRELSDVLGINLKELGYDTA